MVAENANIDMLMWQLREGNQSAFTWFYDQYSNQLYRNILRLVKDEDIAKELLQDLWMKIWTIRQDIDPEKSFKSFLYKVSENIVYGYFRQVAKDRRLIANLIVTTLEYESHAEERMIAKESHDFLYKAISNLSPQRKLIYILCKLEGKSYKEVSEELGISMSTVHNQIIKANKAVKQYFYVNRDIAVLLVVLRILAHHR